MCATSHDRLTAETGKEREARLQQMRDRLASETGEEREARLQQMSAQQRDRLASETAEERESRFHNEIEQVSRKNYGVILETDGINYTVTLFDEVLTSIIDQASGASVTDQLLTIPLIQITVNTTDVAISAKFL